MAVIKELKDIAVRYADLASVYVANGQYFKRAYITGNLQRTVKSYNDVSRVLKEQSEGKFVLALNFAPPGATYGYFVHEGKGTSAKYGRRPYAEVAANDPEIKMLIDRFVQTQIQNKIVSLEKELDIQLKSFSKK
jgi:hypothetical protein